MKHNAMGSYRLSEDAKSDLRRIYMRGLFVHGEVQADAYYNAFFDRFEQLAEHPLLYQPLTIFAQGIGAVCAAWIVSITALQGIP